MVLPSAAVITSPHINPSPEGEPRPVTVYRFEELWREGDRVGLEIECSSGTYVRQLVTALGDAYCEELERTAIGDFQLSDAELLIPLSEALSFLPEFRLDPDSAARAANGVSVPGHADRDVRLTDSSRLIAIARPDGDHLKPFVVFPSA